MTKRKRITRKDTEHAVFGQADPLSAHKLPLNGEVLRNCWRYKCEPGRFADMNEIVKKAALDVCAIWAGRLEIGKPFFFWIKKLLKTN